MKIAFALLACAAAINIREDEIAPEDAEYEAGYAAGVEAATGIEGSEDYLWGFADGVLFTAIPDWEEDEWEDEDYHGEGWKEGDEEPVIELPPDVTLYDAFMFCSDPANAAQEPACTDLLNYCNAEGNTKCAETTE